MPPKGGAKRGATKELDATNATKELPIKRQKTSLNPEESSSDSEVEVAKPECSYLKVSSWNVNGIRAWVKKDGLSFVRKMDPDVLCLQETKCSEDRLPSEIDNLDDDYYCYWTSGDKPGYSGVGLLSKTKPMKVTYGIGIPKHDQEGRVITAEYEDYYIVTAYIPNSGRGLVRLEYRLEWDKDFFAYLKRLDERKQVIVCGDLNVAHLDIDLAYPKSNARNAGFTKEERDSFGKLLESGFTDTFRYLYPDSTGVYTFWTYMKNARASNIGWRLDYFLCSERTKTLVKDSKVHSKITGSDHCPVSLIVDLDV